MKPAAFVVILIAIAYTGFELYAVSRNGYRMEPAFIYSQHVGAAYAVEVCGADKSEQQARFDRNLAYATRRAREALLLGDEPLSASGADAAMAGLSDAARGEVDALVAEHGCDHIEVWRLLRRFDLLAKANPPIRD